MLWAGRLSLLALAVHSKGTPRNRLVENHQPSDIKEKSKEVFLTPSDSHKCIVILYSSGTTWDLETLATAISNLSRITSRFFGYVGLPLDIVTNHYIRIQSM